MTANFGDLKAPVNPRNYFVPNFGIDQDIIDVHRSIKGSEKKLGQKFTADFGLQKAAVNPRDYVVPDFGLDINIKDAQSNIKNAETKLKHNWAPKQDADGYWEDMPSGIDNASYNYNKGQFINNNGLN